MKILKLGTVGKKLGSARLGSPKSRLEGNTNINHSLVFQGSNLTVVTQVKNERKRKVIMLN